MLNGIFRHFAPTTSVGVHGNAVYTPTTVKFCCDTQEWIHQETQAIAAMDFRFSDKGDPMYYVLSLAGNMQVQRCAVYLLV